MSKELAPEVRLIADDLKPAITINSDTGIAEAPTAGDIFAKHLPEGVTMETVKTVQDSLLTFAAAQTLAHGEVQQASMVANKGQDKGTLKTSIGFSSIESSYERSRSGNSPSGAWKKHGVAKTDVVLGAGRKKAQLNQVYNHLSAEAESVFGA